MIEEQPPFANENTGERGNYTVAYYAYNVNTIRNRHWYGTSGGVHLAFVLQPDAGRDHDRPRSGHAKLVGESKTDSADLVGAKDIAVCRSFENPTGWVGVNRPGWVIGTVCHLQAGPTNCRFDFQALPGDRLGRDWMFIHGQLHWLRNDDPEVNTDHGLCCWHCLCLCQQRCQACEEEGVCGKNWFHGDSP